MGYPIPCHDFVSDKQEDLCVTIRLIRNLEPFKIRLVFGLPVSGKESS
jgi:hypothetical protein